MKKIFVLAVSVLAFQSASFAAGGGTIGSDKLALESVQAAQIVRSPGARSCFETLEKGGGELSFQQIVKTSQADSEIYTIDGSTRFGDIMAGFWTIEIERKSGNPELGPVTTCKITKNEE